MKITTEPSDKNPSYYYAYLDGKHICHSKTPMFTAARIFLRAGVSPEEPLYKYRKVDPNNWSMKSTVREAAKWTIQEDKSSGPKRIPYKEFKMADKGGTSPILHAFK